MQADLPTRRPLQDGQRHLPPPRRGRKPLGPPGSRPPSPAVRRGCCRPAPDRQTSAYQYFPTGAVVATSTDVRPRRAGGSRNGRELQKLTARSAVLQPTGPVGACARMTHHAQNSFLWRVSLRTIAIGRPVPALGSSGRRRGVDLGHGLRRAATPGAVRWSHSPRHRAPRQAHIAAERARAQDSTDEGQQEGRPAPTWDHSADQSMAHRQRGLPVPSGRTPDRHEGSPCACVARLRTKRAAGLRCFFHIGVGVGRSVHPTMVRCACHFARALTTPPQDTTQRGAAKVGRSKSGCGRKQTLKLRTFTLSGSGKSHATTKTTPVWVVSLVSGAARAKDKAIEQQRWLGMPIGVGNCGGGAEPTWHGGCNAPWRRPMQAGCPSAPRVIALVTRHAWVPLQRPRGRFSGSFPNLHPP